MLSDFNPISNKYVNFINKATQLISQSIMLSYK